ncbi:MAG: hypothetical protein K2P81_07500 [Bacteriovoracaceae bacterium]|nr:hypothetical protein [Bacteriovoracaceae bacterium]
MKNLLLVFVLFGCAQVTSLNMSRHQFGRLPTKIIWLQVAGLESEQLAMLRFAYPDARETTAMESSMCTGLAWSYNLYQLRPSANLSMLSQVTGKKDFSNKCEDWNQKPVWNYLANNGYKAGVVEVDARSSESLLQAISCAGATNKYTDGAIVWAMTEKAPPGSIPYLPSVAQSYAPGSIYWDKTCNKSECGTSLRPAVASLYSQFSKNSAKHIFVIRDFTLLHALEKKSMTQTREALREIDRTVDMFYELSEDQSDILVLVTGAGSVDIDFPAEGKDWQNFDLKGENALVRKGELLSPVFAKGARSENFCGFYDDSQIFVRLLSGPKQQGLEMKIINPFN